MKKMNNKGFSLVELIVVVLIMAIIAVALAPQVMRWVENSRKSNDIEAYGSLVNALQVAGTDEEVLKNFPSGGVTVYFSESGVSGVSETHLAAAVVRTLPELTFSSGSSSDMKVQGDWVGTGCYNNDTSKQFVITVAKAADGSGLSVTQTNRPTKVFS